MIKAVAQVKEKAIAVGNWAQDAASHVGKAVGNVYNDIKKGVDKVVGGGDDSSSPAVPSTPS